MSFMPIFEIGMWNAWIFMIVLYASAFIPPAMDQEKVDKRMEGEPSGNEVKSVTKVVNIITHMIIMPFTLLYSIFVPLIVGTWWFYTGLLIYLVGVFLVLMYSISFSKAPTNKPMSKGVYAFSRHPGYLGFFLAYLGTGIASSSILFLLCALVWIIAWNFGVTEEEHILVEKYGDAYKDYMRRTPRWIGFPKSNQT